MNDFPVDKSKENQTPLWEEGKNSARETNQVRTWALPSLDAGLCYF